MLQRTFNVLGNGTLLGSVDVNHGTSEKIEGWFKSHPQFGAHQQAFSAAPATSSVADEIKKLSELRVQGLLTEGEFSAQKARLLRGA
jgi:hypothetical protein